MILRDRDMEFLDEDLPINVLPYSNEEFLPAPPTRRQLEIQRVAMRDCEEAARFHGMSRRRFLRTGAAYAITLTAINKVMAGNAAADHADPRRACELHWPGAQRNHPPGEFVMDLQTHHVDSGGDWRITNPGEHAFFAAVWSQSSCGEEDRIECLGRFHYLKELFLDSATDVTVLSAVPYRPDGQPLPIEKAAETCGMVNSLAGHDETDLNSPGRRAVMHRFVMPNRGSLGHNSDQVLGPLGVWPVFMEEEFELMEYSAAAFPEHLRAWKVYCPWGDSPNTSGWWFDDPVGRKFIEKVIDLGNRYHVPKLICAHKGFALPTFDQEKAATRDVGVVAPEYPEVNFIAYHSGYDGDGVGLGGPLNQGTSTRGPYPYDVAPDGTWQRASNAEADDAVRSIDRGVDNFIKALRENGWSARHFAAGGQPRVAMREGDGDPLAHGNVPNVYAELGSVWGSVQNNARRASFLLGKLIYYVGPKRVVWGTDSLWGGSPQGQIVAFRRFGSVLQPGETPDPTKLYFDADVARLYNLPYGLDGDVDDPTVNAMAAGRPERAIRNGVLGRNAAVPYGIDPDATLQAISCDEVQKIRDEYLLNPMTPNRVNGPKTVQETFAAMREDPWHQGARVAQNERGFLRRIG